MVVGVLQVELAIDAGEGASLKDKRRVVMSLKDRLHREHQVSVAEVASQDDRRTAVLGIAVVSQTAPRCQAVLGKVLGKVRAARGCALSDHTMEILPGR